MKLLGEDVAEVLLPAAASARLAAQAWAGPGDDDGDDELPIGDPPDDDEGDDPDDDEDEDEEPLQLAFALQHRHDTRIAAQWRPLASSMRRCSCNATARWRRWRIPNT